MRSHPLIQLTLFKVRTLLREPEALFWVLAFPVLLALGLGIAFQEPDQPKEIPVGVEENPRDAEWVQTLQAVEGLKAETIPADEARLALATGRVVLMVQPGGDGEDWRYWYDPVRPESRLAQLLADDALQRAAGRRDAATISSREMTESGSRFIDFLIPGLLGLNLLSTGIWAVGFYVVQARTQMLLKRLSATPMRRFHFLLSQVSGRLVFLGPEAGLLLGVAVLYFDVPVRGSWLTLLFLVFLGGVSFCGLGLLVSSRTRTVEGVSGITNLILLPMWVLCGVFFPTSQFPATFQPFIQALPLTAQIDALRAVMLEGATLFDVAGEAAIILAWGVVTYFAALKWFKWQ